ncbi:MAG TPA: glycoside hydrolase family 2 TIM barrel-domain containing protein [Pirellulaceae bacterium]|nr:glycoside hydrolase family 2 TIM barrel-domain containing protein [Pirellulaceae bacterium]
MTVDGQPFVVRGVGGNGSRELLTKIGGNTVRTWAADNLQPLLDDCHRLGLKVAVGLWLGHERHGFNYNDADQVARQADQVRATVEKFKDHPAVLLWGLGNEMEGTGAGDNAAIWLAINQLATQVKRIDPNHPTMTVIAEIGGGRVSSVERLCPDVDILGVNSYGGVASLAKRYEAAGGRKPLLITEFGPPGMWETKKNAWNVCVEPTSTAKAEFYRTAWQQGIEGSQGRCLGGFAFLWGHKQEATATWFGMLLPDGGRLAPADALQELWTKKPPTNRCPTIQSLVLKTSSSNAATDARDASSQSSLDKLKPGARLRATLAASDPEGDALKVTWVLQAEPAAYGVGGDAEAAPPTYPEAITSATQDGCDVRLPESGGGYRLFAYVRDGQGGAAVANVPLFVDGPVVVPAARSAKLPLVVYDEADRQPLAFVPSGWMGDTKNLALKSDCDESPHTGKTCLKYEFKAGGGWGGIVWQHPEGDWGDKPGGWNLTGAKQLVLWARGAEGGEVVSFEFGILGADKKFSDTGKAKLGNVRLTKEWQQVTLNLAGLDLSRIKTGLAVVVAGQGRPVTLFLDDIEYR